MGSPDATAEARSTPGATRSGGAISALIRHAPLLLLAGLLVGSAALLMVLGAKLSFFLDDFTFLLYRRGSLNDAILDPHNQNIVIGLSVVYRGLAEAFGIDSTIPFRAVLVALLLVSSVLLFVLLRTRVGDWLALLGVAMTLLMGAAYEDLLWPIQIGYFLSLAGGLGALLALQRGTRGGDLAACALLVLATISFSLGIPFVAGAAVAVALGPRPWRRAWVVAVPAGVYGLWWLGWGHEAETVLTFENVLTSPLFLIDGFASSMASLLGLATPGLQDEITPLEFGRPLLAVAFAAAAYRFYRLLRRGRISPWLWVFLATAAAFWLLAGFNEESGRGPTVSRYQHVGGVFILLIAAQLLAGTRIPRLGLAAMTAIAGLAVASNLYYLEQAHDSYLYTSELERAGMGALEIARDTVDPGLHLGRNLVQTRYVYVSADRYLSAVDAYGSPGYTPAEIKAAPEHARIAADLTLAAALDVAFKPGAARGAQAKPDGAAGPQGACRRVRLAGGPEAVALPAGGAFLKALDTSGEVPLRLHRYAVDFFPVEAGVLPAGGSGRLAIPPDRAEEPWELELRGSGSLLVCGLA